jgi:DNA polymerase-3 subunit chi
MTEFRFYRLERRRIDEALPSVLEEALANGLRAVVQTPSEERLQALDERLWTYAEDSFLPHGGRRDGGAEAQPIFLTADDDNPNDAQVRVLIGAVDAAPFAAGGYERVILMFDARDEEAVVEARKQWSALKAAGAQPSYWREGDGGRWERAR